MTFQWRRDNEDGPADLTTKAPHFFKIIMPQTLQEEKLVRILSSLSEIQMLINVDRLLGLIYL